MGMRQEVGLGLLTDCLFGGGRFRDRRHDIRFMYSESMRRGVIIDVDILNVSIGQK